MGGNSGRKKKSKRLATRTAKPTTEQADQGHYAEIASEVLGLTLTSRDRNSPNPIAMAGFPNNIRHPFQ